MEVLGRQLCKRVEKMGWESVDESSAHHLFDTMPSPLEMFEEDILLVMKEEKVTRDEALHLLQQELRNAQCRMDEKLDCLLEMFGLMGDKRSKEPEEFSTSTRELIPITEVVASPPSQESPSSVPTKCSTTCFDDGVTCLATSSSYIKEEEHVLATALELGNRENKTHSHYIYNCESTKVMPAKCSMVSLHSNGGVDHDGVTFQTMMGMSEGVPASIQSTGHLASGSIADIERDTLMPTRCLMMSLDVISSAYYAMVVFPLMDILVRDIIASMEPTSHGAKA